MAEVKIGTRLETYDQEDDYWIGAVVESFNSKGDAVVVCDDGIEFNETVENIIENKGLYRF